MTTPCPPEVRLLARIFRVPLWLVWGDPATYSSNRAALARHRRRRGKAR